MILRRFDYGVYSDERLTLLSTTYIYIEIVKGSELWMQSCYYVYDNANVKILTRVNIWIIRMKKCCVMIFLNVKTFPTMTHNWFSDIMI